VCEQESGRVGARACAPFAREHSCTTACATGVLRRAGMYSCEQACISLSLSRSFSLVCTFVIDIAHVLARVHECVCVCVAYSCTCTCDRDCMHAEECMYSFDTNSNMCSVLSNILLGRPGDRRRCGLAMTRETASDPAWYIHIERERGARESACNMLGLSKGGAMK
jgi:hypothetical protein